MPHYNGDKNRVQGVGVWKLVRLGATEKAKGPGGAIRFRAGNSARDKPAIAGQSSHRKRIEKRVMKKKPSRKLEKRIEAVEEYLSHIPDTVQALQNFGASTVGLTSRDEARLLALYSLVEEIAAKHGIPAKDFKAHFNRRFEFWHDHVLREFEDQSPSLAAAIDSRDVVSPDALKPYPPLFE